MISNDFCFQRCWHVVCDPDLRDLCDLQPWRCRCCSVWPPSPLNSSFGSCGCSTSDRWSNCRRSAGALPSPRPTRRYGDTCTAGTSQVRSPPPSSEAHQSISGRWTINKLLCVLQMEISAAPETPTGRRSITRCLFLHKDILKEFVKFSFFKFLVNLVLMKDALIGTWWL